MESEREKFEKIGRQAMNIQALEVEFSMSDSEDKPIAGSENIAMIVYNLEKISQEEVIQLLNNGMYQFDSRILRVDPKIFSNIFPHRGEAKSMNGRAYWKSCAYANDFANCECSVCGFKVPAYMAVEFGSKSTDYVGVKYRYCPKCGAKMSYKPGTDESEDGRHG